MCKGSILVSDKDPQIRRVFRTVLVKEGFQITETRDHDSAIDLIHSKRFDLLVLGHEVPGGSGVKTCREIRALSDMGIILVAARAAEREKVDAFRAGADDYITRPFNMPELLARVDAVLRRRAVLSDFKFSQVHLEDLDIDFDRRRVRVGGREERLTPKEFDVLRYLATRANKTVGHRELLQAVWGIDYGRTDECLRYYIGKLRKKIEASPSQPKYLVTVPWVGYTLQLPE